MSSKTPAKIRRAVQKRARDVCEYCLLPDIGALFDHQIDHIISRKHGGETKLENLALACWRCNLYKGTDWRLY
ncbi:MAG: HNH endonuclease signature motif containing protein [Pyrinomonadaceae bacterium]